MGIRSKLTGTSESEMSKEVQEYMDRIVKAVDRSNKERDTAVANLRIEVYELSKQVKELSDKVNMLLPIAKGSIIEEIDMLHRKIKKIKKENYAKKFFSGDNGFLYQLPDMLCGIKDILSGDAGREELSKFYAKTFYPVSNSLLVLKGSLDKLEDCPDLSQLSVEDLLRMRDDLANLAEDTNDTDFPQFYSNLWNVIKDDLTRLCDPDYEDKIANEDALAIRNELSDVIANMEKALTGNGIEIMYAPVKGDENGFKAAANPESPSKPLVRRAKDKYVYAYGIIHV